MTISEHIDEAIAALKAAKPGDPYLPTQLQERIASLLFKGGNNLLGGWSSVAKALSDQGKALALYTVLFPDDDWLLGKGRVRADEPLFGFRAFRAGEAAVLTPEQMAPLVSTEHDVCAIAIMMGALERRKQLP